VLVALEAKRKAPRIFVGQRAAYVAALGYLGSYRGGGGGYVVVFVAAVVFVKRRDGHCVC
jgi:hypothetical protein